MVQRSLNLHPNIICMHELLKEDSGKSVFMRMYLGKREKMLRLRTLDMLAFVEKVCVSKILGINALGFKVLYGHPRNDIIWESVWQKLRDLNVRPIYLRRNVVESYVSFMIAWRSGRWIGGGNEDVKLKIDVNHMLKKCNIWIEKEERAKAILGEGIDILYEDLRSNFTSIFCDLCKYLEVKPLMLEPALKKYTNNRLVDRVENVLEVERGLSCDKKLQKLWAEAVGAVIDQ